MFILRLISPQMSFVTVIVTSSYLKFSIFQRLNFQVYLILYYIGLLLARYDMFSLFGGGEYFFFTPSCPDWSWLGSTQPCIK